MNIGTPSRLLARTGSDVILFDTGAANNFSDTEGKLFESLEAAGVDAADVTKVILTHAHPDHILGAIVAAAQSLVRKGLINA